MAVISKAPSNKVYRCRKGVALGSRQAGHGTDEEVSEALVRFVDCAVRGNVAAMTSLETPPALQTHQTWVRRRWAVLVSMGLLVLNLVANTVYLFNHCPLDLSEDESHYWEWSRHLAMGYYSKGPGIAWIIAAATATARMFGQVYATMPVVRMPAVIFSCISGLASFLLARRIFRDDRAGLMSLVLSGAVPMFAVGSLFITIDSPMYCGWALAVWALWLAVEPETGQGGAAAGAAAPGDAGPHRSHRQRIAWLYAAGLFTGLGMLCKPVLIVLPICALIAAWYNQDIRRRLKTWHSAGSTLLALALQTPVFIWNAEHHWVMFRHIGGEGGMEGKVDLLHRLAGAPLRLLSYLGGQAGGMGGVMFVLLVIATVQVILRLRRGQQRDLAAGWVYLLAMALPLWLFYAALSLWTKVEVNWPAAAYFSGMILLAGVATEAWNQADPKGRKVSRRWFVFAVAWGFALVVLAENFQLVFYPLMARIDPLGKKFPAERFDIAYRVRGLRERADAIQKVRLSMARPGQPLPLVISGRYDTSSSLAFYLPKQPFVYCIMSQTGGRESQYNFWPGLNQKTRTGKLRFAGRNAVLTGSFTTRAFDEVIRPAFQHIAVIQVIPLVYHGVVIRRLNVWRCYGFKGLPHVDLGHKLKF